MSEASESGLVYHVERKRRLRGFLPLYVVLAVLPVGAVLWLVPVRMPEELPEPRTGRVYYRDGRLMYFQLMQRSPQPFSLPEGADPAGESAARLVVPLRRHSDYVALPPADLYEDAGDSCVLNEEALLALPPEPTAEEQGEAPAAAASADDEAAIGKPAVDDPAVDDPDVDDPTVDDPAADAGSDAPAGTAEPLPLPTEQEGGLR